MKKLLSLLVATILSVAVITPASAAETVLVTGSVKTIDGIALPDLSIALTNRATNERSSVKVGVDGKFILQIPEGDYSGFISSASSPIKGLCLEGSFKKTITKNTSTLSVNLPSLRTFEFNFVDGAGNFVPGISMFSQFMSFKVPENSDIEAPYFSCSRAWPQFQPSAATQGSPIVWKSFELAEAPSGLNQTNRMTYKYLSGLGQSMSNSLLMEASIGSKYTTVLQDVPGIALGAKSLRPSKTALVGFATFTEAPAFVGLSVERTLKTSVRVLRKGKWSSWSLRIGKTGSVDANGRVSISIPTKGYAGSTIEVVVSGVNFNAASQVVRIKVPK